MTTTTARRPTISPEAFHGSESGHVYAVIDDPGRDVPAVASELLASGVALEDIHMYRSCEGSATAGPNRGKRPFLARMYRAAQSVDGHLGRIERELAQGRALIAVAVEDARKVEVAETLRRHQAHDVVYYGKYTWQWLGA